MSNRFLLSDVAGKIVGVFKDVFLGIYFLKITEGNIISVCLYYIAFYLSYLFFLLMVNKLRKMNLTTMFRVGIFLNLMQCLILLLAGNNISNHIFSFAIFSSIGNAFYYYPEQILIKRVNKDDDFQNYVTKDQIIKHVVSIIMPIILGLCISKNSYSLAFIVLGVLVTISFIFSLSIKNFNLKHEKIDLKVFFKNVKKTKSEKLMVLSSIRTFLRGLSSFGVLATLITILTFMVVKTEFSLGNISSFITVISIMVIYGVNRCVKRKILCKLFVPLAIIQSIVVILLSLGMIYFDVSKELMVGGIMISVGFILVLLYNLINGISNPIFETFNQVVYYELMKRQHLGVKDEPSYVFWFEIMINLSRSLGYLILIIVSNFMFNINVIVGLIVLFTLVYISFAYVLSKIGKEYLLKE